MFFVRDIFFHIDLVPELFIVTWLKKKDLQNDWVHPET